MKNLVSTRVARSLRMSVELLEERMLLHAGELHEIVSPLGHDHSEEGPLQQETTSLCNAEPVDPHFQEDPRFNEPVNFDEILGVPTGSAGPESDRLPDFFPSLSGSFSVDQTSQPGRNLIRFGTQVNNQGDGPGILISGRPGIDAIPSGAPITSWVNEDGTQNVLQGIYNYSGSSFSLSHYRAAGQFIYHTGHGHFHFNGYADYRLRYNVGGQPGDYVQRPDGTGIIGAKVGFCLINIASSFTMENGQSSTTIPTYNRPGQPSTGCGLLQGVHVGHADIYSASLQGQWIDVTGIPNGQYFFEIELDAEHAVLESNDINNTKTFPLNVNINPPSGGITPDEYDTGTNNNSFDNATDMGVLGTFTKTGLNIHWGQDHDYFRFEASSSGTYTVTASPANGDVNIFLYDANRVLLRSSTNSSGNEQVSYSFVKGETYYLKAQSYNSTTSSNYQIGWNLKPEASSLTSVRLAAETGQTGRFVIMRNGPTTSPVTVRFSLTGTATEGVDYQSVGTSITIGNLASTGEIEITPIADGQVEGRESVILTITSNNAYVIGDTGSSLYISDRFGDFNTDGALDISDLDLLVQNIAVGPVDPATFDVTLDGQVNLDDINEWLTLAGLLNLPTGNPYLRGDANLDGFVDASDFNQWNLNKFTANAAWSAGDFNADGSVDASDYNIWNENKFLNSVDGRFHSDVLTPTYSRSAGLTAQSSMESGRRERVEQIMQQLDRKNAVWDLFV